MTGDLAYEAFLWVLSVTSLGDPAWARGATDLLVEVQPGPYISIQCVPVKGRGRHTY